MPYEEDKSPLNGVNHDLEPGPEKDFTLKSNIPSLVEDKQTEEKRGAVLNLVNDVAQQREEIDKINESIKYIAEKMELLFTNTTKQNELITQFVQGNNSPTQPNFQANQLMDILNSPLGEKLANRIFPTEEKTAHFPGLDPNYIMNRAVESVQDNFEIGKVINDSIKNSLKRTAVNRITKSLTSLNDDGHQPI